MHRHLAHEGPGTTSRIERDAPAQARAMPQRHPSMTVSARTLKRFTLSIVFAAVTLTDAAAQQANGGNDFFHSWFRDPTLNADTMPRPQWGTVATTPVPATRSRSAETVARPAPATAARAPATATPGGPIDITRRQSAPNPQQATSQAAAPAATGPSADRQYVDGIYLLNTDYWLGYPKHVYKLVTAPARFDTKDWMITGGLLAGAGLLVALDEDIQSFWQDNIAGGGAGDFVGAFEPLGRTWYAVAGGAGVYVAAEAAEQLGGWNLRREKAAGLLTIESVLISQAITSGIKELSGRSRPNATDDAFLFEGPGNGNSFPSGHATVAFAVATTISNVYGEDYAWVPWIAYPVATATALARVEDNKHWASDVFVGGLIGYAVAKTVTLYNPFLKENKLAIRPLRDGSAQGAALVVGF
jgi:membrane-associated phospholipid phosphatase